MAIFRLTKHVCDRCGDETVREETKQPIANSVEISMTANPTKRVGVGFNDVRIERETKQFWLCPPCGKEFSQFMKNNPTGINND